jgi:hypothetical protein
MITRSGLKKLEKLINIQSKRDWFIFLDNLDGKKSFNVKSIHNNASKNYIKLNKGITFTSYQDFYKAYGINESDKKLMILVQRYGLNFEHIFNKTNDIQK